MTKPTTECVVYPAGSQFVKNPKMYRVTGQIGGMIPNSRESRVFEVGALLLLVGSCETSWGWGTAVMFVDHNGKMFHSLVETKKGWKQSVRFWIKKKLLEEVNPSVKK